MMEAVPAAAGVPISPQNRPAFDSPLRSVSALVFQLTPSRSYGVPRSTDLLTWETMQTLTTTDNGMLPYTD